MKLSIVIPAYNEERTIETVLRRVQAVPLGDVEKEIIVVDDGSTDGTAEILKRLDGIAVLRHAVNAGKGAALSTGFRAATGEILLIQDADLEYDPADYAAVIRPIRDGQCDVVMGSRFLLERPVFFGPRRSPYFLHYAGNLLIVLLTNVLYGKRFTDYEGCYKAFRRDAVRPITVRAKGFEFDNELMCRLFRRRARVMEVPIRYRPRLYAQGKKITYKHGLIIAWTILKWRFLAA
jgi:glycosyltransferase involved in cell wall biosynthesis